MENFVFYRRISFNTLMSPILFFGLSKKSTEIYLDSSLGDGEMKGEDFAVILHELGYENINMASGYVDEKFVHLAWIKCVGKKSPCEVEY